MSDHLVESPAPVMSESAFQRRREHLLAELERPASHRRHVLAVVLLPSCSLCWRSLRSVARVSAIAWLTPRTGGLRRHHRRRIPARHKPSALDDWNRPGSNRSTGSRFRRDAKDLLSDLGPASDTITAFPTSNGTVCYMIHGAGTCVNLQWWPWNTIGFTSASSLRTPAGHEFSASPPPRSRRWASKSPASSIPRSLEFTPSTTTYLRSVQESDLQQVTATWSDGSTHTMPLHRHWNPPHR